MSQVLEGPQISVCVLYPRAVYRHSQGDFGVTKHMGLMYFPHAPIFPSRQLDPSPGIKQFGAIPTVRQSRLLRHGRGVALARLFGTPPSLGSLEEVLAQVGGASDVRQPKQPPWAELVG